MANFEWTVPGCLPIMNRKKSALFPGDGFLTKLLGVFTTYPLFFDFIKRNDFDVL